MTAGKSELNVRTTADPCISHFTKLCEAQTANRNCREQRQESLDKPA